MRRAIESVPRGAWPRKRRIGIATLDFDHRHRRRIALATDDGIAFLLDLPEGNVARWDALADRQMHTPIARANRWLDARLAPVARLCRRIYLDRIVKGVGLALAMLTLVAMTFGAPLLAFFTIRWIGQLAEKFGMLFDGSDAE